MKKNFLLLLLILPLIFLSGCGEDDDSNDGNVELAQGWHFPGRDCLACHNVDLASDKNLLIGVTLYKDNNITDVDDMNEVCGGEFVINFLDNFNGAIQVSSKDYEDVDSSGYQGKGNIFILSRKLDTLNGDFYIEIVEKTTNNPIAVSYTSHKISTAINDENQNSCNSCHRKDGKKAPIYAKNNSTLCK